MKTLGIIVARSGSKGLPGKHLKKILGKPVIDYSFEHALESKNLDRLILSTDDEDVAKRAAKNKIEVCDRPKELAGDKSTLQPVLIHVLKYLEEKDRYIPELIALIQGNIPIREKGIIDKAIRFYSDNCFDNVRSFSPVGKYHPQFAWNIDAEGETTRYAQNRATRRQDLPKLYFPDGAAFIINRNVLLEWEQKKDPLFWGKNRGGIVQSSYAAYEIDEPVDLHIAEALINFKKSI